MKSLLDTKLMHPSEQITLIMLRIYERVLTTTSGGNISVMDEEENIWITPAGVDKGLLKPSDIVCVKKDGTVSGEHKPSSEYPFHLAIYQQRPDIKAIIHAHPPGIVAFSIVRTTPDTRVLPQTYALCGEVGYAPYAMPGTEALGVHISHEFAKGYSVVIMENHGAVMGGTDLSNAYQKFESVEVTARAMLCGKSLGEPVILTEEQLDGYARQLQTQLPQQESAAKYPAKEREKRAQILKIIKRACKQGLMLGAYGSVSTRWGKDDFVITPRDVSKWDLTLDDLVQVRNGKRELHKIPDVTASLHQAIYKKHPHVNAIIMTQPIYLSSFAITGRELKVRTIPETWIYLQDVLTVDFGSQFAENERISDLISEQAPVIIVKNECVIVTGNKLLQAFDYLEVAEFSAKSLVLSASLGAMIPISDSEVEALGKVMSRWKNYEWKM
ncbi:MAG TPA: class II aldolase/adducin family protein [Niabella sp.]